MTDDAEHARAMKALKAERDAMMATKRERGFWHVDLGI